MSPRAIAPRGNVGLAKTFESDCLLMTLQSPRMVQFNNNKTLRKIKQKLEEEVDGPLTQGEGMTSTTSVKLGGGLVSSQGFEFPSCNTNKEEEEVTFQNLYSKLHNFKRVGRGLL